MLEIPPLPDTTILLVEVGSTAHGTGIPGGEDHDELGVVVETPEQLVGLDEDGFRTVMQRTQPEGARSGPGDIDRTLHSLRRFVRLAASGNPSILMSFWAPVEMSTSEGDELRALGDAFVGRHVIPRYRGYMESQASRLLGLRGGGHGRRGGGQRDELIDAHGFDCYLADTEFLTPAGWRTYDEIADGVPVGTMNPVTSQFEFQIPTARVDKPYSGPLISVEHRDTEFVVTPNHRLWLSPASRRPGNGFSTAYDTGRARWQIVRAEEWVAGPRDWFHGRHACEGHVAEYPVSDAMLRLIGSYVTEGCVAHRGLDGTPREVRIDQRVGGRLEPTMNALQEAFAGRSYFYTKPDRDAVYRSLSLRAKGGADVETLVADCGEGSRHKRLPPWTLHLSESQAGVLLNAMHLGDGTDHRSGGEVLYTTSRRLADSVQALCVVNGISCVIWGPYSYDGGPGMYQVRTSGRSPINALSARQNARSVECVGERIVCFTVPNELLVTRRGGKVAVQGNTKYAMHSARLGFQGLELLATGKLELPIQGEPADWLRAVRRGDVSFDEWWNRSLELDAQLEAMQSDESIPPGPDRVRIESWMVDVHQRVWARLSD